MSGGVGGAAATAAPESSRAYFERHYFPTTFLAALSAKLADWLFVGPHARAIFTNQDHTTLNKDEPIVIVTTAPSRDVHSLVIGGFGFQREIPENEKLEERANFFYCRTHNCHNEVAIPLTFNSFSVIVIRFDMFGALSRDDVIKANFPKWFECTSNRVAVNYGGHLVMDSLPSLRDDLARKSTRVAPGFSTDHMILRAEAVEMWNSGFEFETSDTIRQSIAKYAPPRPPPPPPPPPPEERPRPPPPNLTDEQKQSVSNLIGKLMVRLEHAEARLADSMAAKDKFADQSQTCYVCFETVAKPVAHHACTVVSHVVCTTCAPKLPRCGMCQAQRCGSGGPTPLLNPAARAVEQDKSKVEFLKKTAAFVNDASNADSLGTFVQWLALEEAAKRKKREFDVSVEAAKSARAYVGSDLLDAFMI